VYVTCTQLVDKPQGMGYLGLQEGLTSACSGEVSVSAPVLKRMHGTSDVPNQSGGRELCLCHPMLDIKQPTALGLRGVMDAAVLRLLRLVCPISVWTSVGLLVAGSSSNEPRTITAMGLQGGSVWGGEYTDLC
jgi:hypothetical protein